MSGIFARFLARLGAGLVRAPRPVFQQVHAPGFRGVRAALVVLLAGGAVAAFGIAPFAPDIADQPVTRVTESLSLSAGAPAAQAPATLFVQEARVEKGDSLNTLFDRLGIKDDKALGFARQDAAARKLLSVRPGRSVSVGIDQSGDLLWLNALLAPDENSARVLKIARSDDGRLNAREVEQQYERRTVLRSGVIQSSLYGATDAAGIPDGVTAQMVDVLASNIDFYNDLRKGDTFEVSYEQYALPTGEVVRSGRLLALEFVNAGRRYEAVWYDGDGSNGAFYTFDGKSLKKAFLRTPVEFTRVSSGFGSRLHPILGYTRQHEGIDFAAPRGTGIRAASDGVVEFSGTQRGFGNVVIIKHQGAFETLYAHMSGFAKGVQKGAKVKQGDVIGYVGSTGWATGPHLHYEIHVNKAPVNPQTIALPDAQPIAPTRMADFRRHADDMRSRLALIARGNTASQVARAE